MKSRLYALRNPLRALATLVFGAALTAVPARADAGIMFFYKFTPVADTKGGFPFVAFPGFPVINSGGRVAYIGRYAGGAETINSRRLPESPRTIVDTQTSNYFTFGIGLSMNSLDTVQFVGLRHGNDEIIIDIVRGEDGSTTKKLMTVPGDQIVSQCSGVQINIQKTAVFAGTRSNGRRVILTAGAGELAGVVRTVATEGAEFSSLGCSPSIDSDSKVAFMGTRNGRRGIFTIGPHPSTTVTVMVDDSGPFAGFTDVALNRNGGLAFGARIQGSGDRVVERLQNNVLTKIGDTNPEGGAISINDSGEVIYEVNTVYGSSVFRGPKSFVSGRVVGPGSVVLGRTVSSAHIDRDSLNSVGQVAAWLSFYDGTVMIARGEPVRADVAGDPGGLQLTVSDGGVSAGTTLPTPPVKGRTLSFDVSFLTPQGKLTPTLNGVTLKSIAASAPGVLQHISIPLAERPSGKSWPTHRRGELRFALDGKPGAVAQISNVSIPGWFDDRIDDEALSRWRPDTSRGGSVDVVSIARLPMKIRLTRVERPQAAKINGELVQAAVLSSEAIDATTDLDRATLRVGGFPARTERDRKGKAQLVCEERDVNDDKRKDLVCEVEVKGLAKAEKDKKTELRLEAMTQFGWGISGADVLGAPAAAK